jgi:hypothetical protein
MIAKGTFEVKVTPLKDEGIGDPTIGRFTLEKQLHGDIEGTSKGQMLAAMGEVQGSAGAVAIERVRGTLHGRAGSFALQHNSTMSTATGYHMNIVVPPDSGTEQLAGISEKFTITQVDGKHFYEFDYTLHAAR